MKYRVLTVGLKGNLISWCQTYFSAKNIELSNALDTSSIHMLRKKIEPDSANPIYIKTVYRVGYRFTGNIVETCDD